MIDTTVFDPASLAGVPWLVDLVESAPESFSWPRHMSPVHPRAVGSYGLEAEEWIAGELKVNLRHWQRLALRRQLEHDADGALVWQSVIESTPRRAGKSVRLRCAALERIAHAERYGEQQLVLHCGKDAPIAREIHRRAWQLAKERGWHVRQQNGNEEIETPDGSRWLVRGAPSVYGYDVGLGIVDEAWGVDSIVVDDGLEPALMERTNPQLWLLSTAHRRATSLMRKRIETALAELRGDQVEDQAGDTLLMLWCAGELDDIADEETWRRASPYWTEQRRRMIGGKYRRALAGEADPELDDPDPLEGFRAQYLNVWPAASKRRMLPGRPLVTEAEWQRMTHVDREQGPPACAAIEAWYQEGVSAAFAWPLSDGKVLVEVTGHPDVPKALRWAQNGSSGVVVAGKSLLSLPVFRTTAVEPVGMTSRAAVEALRRLIDEDALRVVDDGGPLADQVRELRTLPGTDGPRLVSKSRTDAVKAAVWAAHRAMSAPERAQVF